AFDISPKAIAWAKQVHDGKDIDFLVADMFAPPEDWLNGFDLVVEVYTIQALPLALREKSIDAIASFVAAGGRLVAVQRLRDEAQTEPEGPPWALSRAELKRFEELGLELTEFETYFGDEEEPVERFVALFRKSG
ncbi:MAG: SAM-dependent methyltransferase, partial [Pyrinomonadaceae bacterium]|nr:SAM-dependent methyltransferase [Pyrinomonadaceae bacterium]